MEAKLGIIGGTGFYDLVGLGESKHITLKTPFGDASDDFSIGKINGREIVFIPRHGRNHTILPDKINYRANVWGLKKLGVTHVITISAVGSFQEEIEPGSIIFIDQYLDRTKEQGSDTFFDQGAAVHISFGDPVCPCIHGQLIGIAKEQGVRYTENGSYVNIQGPAFSTRAESNLYRSWGMSVVGMTNMYEARLCREAELHFGTIAQVTDYDSWKEEAVNVPAIVVNLKKSLESAGKVVAGFIEKFPFPECQCDCSNALKPAIYSDIKLLSPALKERYSLLLEKYYP
ncbi:MAG: MTAP family purine nucleoside phosphorylase [Candidatus Marinimicrobia bacterium]|nr:MTAP family purine nucleoside phosphorylase [Candidatus Neomarinimicrobiota bacterium]